MSGQRVQNLSTYSRLSISLHWLIALLVIGNIAGGLYMSDLFDSRVPASMARGAEIAALHKPVGITILLLTLFRIGIRLHEGFPALPSHMKRWEVVLARVNHIGFYVLLLAIPFAGWAFAVTPERPLSFFGLLAVPFSPFSESARGFFHEMHELGGELAAVLVVLHVAGALKHYYLDRDDILARMLPFLRRDPRQGA